ncbi:hypothetical protein [Dyella silvatica]|uniref:hypothetical protein n=1 Tax=Dyella silvatica TaxID=2992128 RepID=UPI00225B637C|nr:hypothetical protein [Dyella silvatica]
MSNQVDTRIEPPAQTNAVPLRFMAHNFAAHCYNTQSCSVVYDNHQFTRPYEDNPSGAPDGPDYQRRWGTASYLGVSNFPSPAEVRWTSHDGVAHEAKVDIGDIFKSELIWHGVPKADMADFYEGPVAGVPNVFLEVNDRTINAYMKMLVPTKTEQIPGNKYSYGRNDLFLAWSHTY